MGFVVFYPIFSALCAPGVIFAWIMNLIFDVA